MKYIKPYLAFWTPYLAFIAGIIYLLLTHTKANLHLWLTSFHTPKLDVFFRFFTEIGGWFPYLLVVLLLFYKLRAAGFVLATQLLSGLAAQIAKKLWAEPRPKLYFNQNFPDVELHVAEGVRLHSMYSFPSGHTTAVFALFFALTLLTRNKTLHATYLILAVIAGYSRVYL